MVEAQSHRYMKNPAEEIHLVGRAYYALKRTLPNTPKIKGTYKTKNFHCIYKRYTMDISITLYEKPKKLHSPLMSIKPGEKQTKHSTQHRPRLHTVAHKQPPTPCSCCSLRAEPKPKNMDHQQQA
ncbi:hypothetical protein PHAVU_010G077400 [Phaseolus vulgaris]|uniref:Uncharacterized protein n=1 Tax=Phaseolus vulgaris TaxID=3885 RepID=V7AMS6_PHAVU|nr:hypothetical protein PHAVU_010G077400g [Phaseolus vulgaris]ESW06794.1 hypothetical protein PHAVU_010G077400g [Phaseolus vulgaris]